MPAAAAGCAAGGVAAYRGHVFPGGVVGLTSVWCESRFTLLTAQDFPSTSLLATAVIVAAAALLFKPRHSAIFAVVTIVTTWPIALLSPAVRASGVTPSVLFFLMSHTVVMSAVWSVVSLGFSLVDRAFVEVVRKERALAETIDRSPDGILVVDANELLQVINPAAERMLGVHRDERIGRRMADLMPRASNAADARTAMSFEGSGERPTSWAITRSDGVRLELEISWRSMDGGRRQLVLRDVSERVRAEQLRRDMELQLAHAQRLEAVGQLAGAARAPSASCA